VRLIYAALCLTLLAIIACTAVSAAYTAYYYYCLYPHLWVALRSLVPGVLFAATASFSWVWAGALVCKEVVARGRERAKRKDRA